MVPTIKTDDERATKILDNAGVPYELIESPKPTEAVREDYVINPADYILLEGKSGKDGYPDLYVCKYRLGVTGINDVVRNVGEELGLDLENTAREKNGRGYVGNINRKQALKLNLMLGGKTLNTRTGKDVFKLLFSGKAFDGNGKKIPNAELSQIAEEITGMRTPSRAELFEDYFTMGDDGLILNKNYVLQNNVLVPEYSRVLTSCLMNDKTPKISLVSLLENSTAQGYPRKNVKSGELSYWYPRQDSAVKFYASLGNAIFHCYGNPQYSDGGLGIRHVHSRQKELSFLDASNNK